MLDLRTPMETQPGRDHGLGTLEGMRAMRRAKTVSRRGEKHGYRRMVNCRHCGRHLTSYGLARHEKACERKRILGDKQP